MATWESSDFELLFINLTATDLYNAKEPTGSFWLLQALYYWTSSVWLLILVCINQVIVCGNTAATVASSEEAV